MICDVELHVCVILKFSILYCKISLVYEFLIHRAFFYIKGTQGSLQDMNQLFSVHELLSVAVSSHELKMSGTVDLA